jgi:hypothetical protein
MFAVARGAVLRSHILNETYIQHFQQLPLGASSWRLNLNRVAPNPLHRFAQPFLPLSLGSFNDPNDGEVLHQPNPLCIDWAQAGDNNP